MQAKVRSKYEVDYLDDSKKHIGGDVKVFRMRCTMLELMHCDWNKYPCAQYGCKNISDWNVVVDTGKIVVWSDEVDNLFLFYLDADTKDDSITEAVCNLHGDSKAYIRFIPECYRHATHDETGTIKSISMRMAIEIGMECSGEASKGNTRYIGYFYNEDLEELMAFADELVMKCSSDQNALDKFDWGGSVCRTIKDFK